MSECKRYLPVIDTRLNVVIRSMSPIDVDRVKDLLQQLYEVVEIEKEKVDVPFYGKAAERIRQLEDSREKIISG